MFAGLIAIQFSSYQEYRQELNRLAAELAQEEQIAVDLRYRQAFYESDAYIERLAREMLDFVRQDEIIFRNIAN
jgi:cell division protein FtsB